MLDVLAAGPGPKIMVGDFNAEAKAPELAPL
jgi:endonuclease/exonuclease/phosphatase (EEP) superfamily protein YafD